MPSLGMLNIPAPREPKEFEEMLVDYCNIKYNPLSKGNVQLYGRQGQNQNGLDIVVKTQDNLWFGIQCKDYLKSNITPNSIDKYIEDGKLNFKLNKFIIALSKDYDVILQNYVYGLSQKRKNTNTFEVEIIFWKDILNVIIENKNIFYKYYNYIQDSQPKEQISCLIGNEKNLINFFLNTVILVT